LNYLANGLLGSADFPPNTQQREVHAMFREQLTGLHKRLDEVVSKDVEAFNKTLRDRNMQGLITRVQ